MVLNKNVSETTVLPGNIDLKLRDFSGVFFAFETDSLSYSSAGLKHKWLRMTLLSDPPTSTSGEGL